ncbi:MAG: phosphatase PAP2 family protein [Clostridia bacterium]|nr:phosphatase PAP2 family protein [Clostridia bacterium]
MTGPAVFESLRSIASPGLDRTMKAITDLGSSSFYMLVVPVIYWCVNKSLGFGLGIVTSISSYINVGLKCVFKVPRPYVAYPRLGAPAFLTDTGTGWSFPSGHAQGLSTFWTYIARRVRRTWATVAGIAIVVAVAFTRVYATCHYPEDVVVGAALGLIIAWAYVASEGHFARTGNPVSIQGRLAASIAAPIVVFALSSIDPTLARGSSELLGFLLGLGVGHVIEDAYVKYDVRAGLPVQAAKVVLGLGALLGIRYGLKAIFPPHAFWNMLRYAIMALWGALGAPMAFKALFRTHA